LALSSMSTMVIMAVIGQQVHLSAWDWVQYRDLAYDAPDPLKTAGTVFNRIWRSRFRDH
jgi:hypothetical protein